MIAFDLTELQPIRDLETDILANTTVFKRVYLDNVRVENNYYNGGHP